MSVGYREWKILIVDDEPDVLSVTKLAMRDFSVMGIPVNIMTAGSMAEAIELYGQEESWMAEIAVALIDVVMETDTAGLDLCRYIREEAKDRNVQLYIRTGQPGVAPEREVVDRYDISGYFSKAEATEDKLYSLVKSGVRQYETTRNLQGALAMLEGVIESSHSKAAMRETFLQMLSGFIPIGAEGVSLFWTVGDEPVLGPVGWDEAEARQAMASMAGAPAEQLRPEGDSIAISEEGKLLITIPASERRPEALAMIRFEGLNPPARVMSAIHGFLRNFAALYPRAAD